MGHRVHCIQVAVTALMSLSPGMSHAWGLKDVVQAVATVAAPVQVLVVAPVVQHVAGAPAAKAAAPIAATVAAPTVAHVEKNLVAPATKAGRDVAAATGKELEKAAQATGKAAERSAKALPLVVAKAAKRVKEGKLVEAVLMPQVDFYRDQEETAFEAVDHSVIVRTGVRAVASTYGGPLGGPAFDAWYVSKKTEDLGAGLRAGAISAVTGTIQKGVAQTDALGVGGKAVASGATGGIATAASGGKFEDGVVSGSAASIATSIYTGYTRAPLDSRPGEGPISKVRLADKASCDGVVKCFVVETADDMRAVPHRYTNIGTFAGPAGPQSWMEEGSRFMRGVNYIPGFNAMSYIHDLAAVDARWTSYPALISTIPPAIVFTYYANGDVRDRELLDTNVASAERRKARSAE
jgi:hypothetical protein